MASKARWAMSIISRTSMSPNDLPPWKALVDEVNLCLAEGGENSSEEVDLGAEQHGEDGSDKLSNDDSSEDSDEEREELSELAQVEVQSCVGSSVGGSRNLVAGGGLIGGGVVGLLVGGGVIGGGRGGVLRSSIFR